jgi:hypothetical protein
LIFAAGKQGAVLFHPRCPLAFVFLVWSKASWLFYFDKQRTFKLGVLANIFVELMVVFLYKMLCVGLRSELPKDGNNMVAFP